MVHPPRRSVTRFFIPLIDVLILLFCIFLLMPFVSGPGASAEFEPLTREVELSQLEQELAKARALAEQERQARQTLLGRLVVRVLMVDGQTGGLFPVESPREELRTQAAAHEWIARQRRSIGTDGEPYFLILLPREATGFPEERQLQAYRRWFAHVPHGIDNPSR